MPTEQLTIRSATDEDAREISGLFQLTYGDSSHPCKDAQRIVDSIRSGVTAWRVALDEERIVACGTLIVNRWNQCWEIGRAITLPEYRGAGIATQLMQRNIEDACLSSYCDLLVGFPRSRTMLNIARDVKPAFLPVGHDGAINVANGLREYHTVTFALNPYSKFRHCVPSFISMADTDFVRDNIFEPLGFSPERGEYPPVWIAGDGYQLSDLEPFAFEYDPFCASNSLEVTGCNREFRDAPEAANALLLMLESFYHVRHVRLAVLLDKTDFIEYLVGAGFEITAYLPAWYRHGDARYDCVLLVRGSFSEEPIDHGIRDVVEHFRYGLRQC